MSPITVPSPRSARSPSPSFEIRGAIGSSASALRWDRVNSAALLAQARSIYAHYLTSCAGRVEPLGVVLEQDSGRQGRVVFEAPVLLPDEHYVPLELLRGRTARWRTQRR